MARRTWLGEFPGGVLEINAYDDDPTDGHPGVYPEVYGPADDTQRGDEMRYRPRQSGICAPTCRGRRSPRTKP